jgi:hypothetical protein
MTRLTDFNPTSRQNIAWALQTFRGARFTRITETGKPKVDEATLSEVRDIALSAGNQQLHDECEMFIRLLTLQKWLGQLSEGTNSWFNSIEGDGCIHHSCTLSTQTGRNAHRGPNLGQVVSAPWARELFVPHPGHVMVGADLEGLELRLLGHYLAAFDEGSFAEVVVNGDIHQQNADRVGCTRTQVKTLTYAFIYGAGDVKLGHSLQPELSDAQKKTLGGELRRKFLDAIPGLEPLVDAVKLKVRSTGRLRGLDGRPIFCRAEHSSPNFLLQSAGAIISKRWVVIGQQLLTMQGLTYDVDYTRCAYVHDEVQMSVVPAEVDRMKMLLEAAAPEAGKYYNLRVPIGCMLLTMEITGQLPTKLARLYIRSSPNIGDASTLRMRGRNGKLHLTMEFPMTQIQARAVENARKEYRRAQNELRVHRLSETAYRGIPTVSILLPQ